MDQLAPERAGAGEEEEGDADAGAGQDVPFEYICEEYCQHKKNTYQSILFSHYESILKLKSRLAWEVGYGDSLEDEPCVL